MTKPFHPDELRVRIRAGERILSLETREVAIFAMAKLAESRDPETGEHLERMRSYSRILAQHLVTTGEFADTVDEEYVRLIYLTSPLHDIGKVGIPDSVLLKPGAPQQPRIRDHEAACPHRGGDAGGGGAAVSRRDLPAHGAGHRRRTPRALRRKRLPGRPRRTGHPAGRRIVAVADVYDAPTFEARVQARLCTGHCAEHDRGRQRQALCFDARRAAFVENEDRFLAIREQFAEPQMVLV